MAVSSKAIAENTPASNVSLSASDQTVGDAVVHRSEVAYGNFGVDLPNCSLHRESERFRRNAAADDHEQMIIGTLRVRIINRTLCCFVGVASASFHRSDFADHGIASASFVSSPPRNTSPAKGTSLRSQ